MIVSHELMKDCWSENLGYLHDDFPMGAQKSGVSGAFMRIDDKGKTHVLAATQKTLPTKCAVDQKSVINRGLKA